ncbi:MAG: c-type cytochrome [Phycisphaerales bacterium]|nr:c-type cytochrome [Phycisphaerales bacterium]
MIRRLFMVLCGSGVVALAACDWMPGRPERPTVDAHAPTMAFEPLWNTHCAGCHGANGRDGAARPLNDPLYLSLADDHWLHMITTHGVDGTLMPAMGTAAGGPLTPAQITVLIEGMHDHWGGAALQTAPPLLGELGAADAGATVFASHCAACHGDDGTGGHGAGSVVDTSFLALTSDQALRIAVICGRIDLGMPPFDGRRGLPPLTDQQVSDVVAWLAAHRVAHPGAPYPAVTSQGAQP